MDKISRQEAKQAGFTRYFTGEPCTHGHIDERLVSNCVCITCATIRKKNHPEYQQKTNKKSLEAKRIWRRNDYTKNPEKYRAYAKKYRDSNKEKRCAYESLRKNRQTNATPQWLNDQDKKWLDEIYKESKTLKERYGIDCTVDHIVPIKGENVCGLHVPWNLRLMDKSANSAKRITIEQNSMYKVTNGNILAHNSVLPWNLRSRND